MLKFRKIQLNIHTILKYITWLSHVIMINLFKKIFLTKCDSLKNNIKNNNEIKEKLNFNSKKTFFQ